MNLRRRLEKVITRLVPRASAISGEELSYTATRAISRVGIGASALGAGAVGVLLLDSEWRGVLAGALLAWGASAVVWAYTSFTNGQEELLRKIRHTAEQDVLHARLNLISGKFGIAPMNLDAEWESIVQHRMSRLAHYGGLDEVRIFREGWYPHDEAVQFWSPESLGWGDDH